MRLYLAAPLFTPQERAFNNKLKSLLTEEFQVFLPQEDGRLIVDLLKEGLSEIEAKKRVFERDICAIKSADVILAVLDGRTIDEGVAFELGYGFSHGLECWAYKDDWRTLAKFGDNPMIEGCISKWFLSMDDLEKHVVQRQRVEYQSVV